MRGGGVFSSLLCCLKYSLLKLENIPVYMRIYSRFCFFSFHEFILKYSQCAPAP